jgi:glucokinase
VARQEWPSHADRGPEPMLRDFLQHARSLLERSRTVEGVGVSIGGPLNTRTGVVLSPPHLPGWDNVPLTERLRTELHLPVVVEHDAAACLEAEVLWGAARGTTHAVYLTCGTGCGSGVMIDGRILRGPHGQSPEVGHVRLAPDGPELFGKAGCVESFCSGQGIGLLAGFLFPERFSEPIDTEGLARLAEGGDRDAREVLLESARRTGQLCSLLADLMAPEVIVLGSLARYLPGWWREEIIAAFRRESLEINSRHTRIVPAALGDKLQDLSAIAPCVWAEPA